jgi:hypothetical protein
MRKIYLTIIISCYFLNAYSQRVDYDHTSKWFLGFNVGATWNSTDVKNQTSAGWGFTLGKSYNYDYGKILSFDLRGRYLRGYWYGQDFDTTSLANYSGGALTSYKDSLGFSVNNFQSDVHRIALELAIHANKIRERTGLDPYIFGGVGLTWNQTYGDLKNEFGDYAYDDLLNNGELNSSMIENTLDGIFDSPLDGSSDKYKVNFMPSLGFGLGYQVGKRVSIGIEHKTTFTLDDNFDGYISTSPRIKNDRYHYTSFYIEFRFRTNESTNSNDETTNTNTSNNINNYNTACPKPVITVSQNAVTGTNNSYLLEATITNINNANEITIINQNGANIPFNLVNQNKIQANVSLMPGANTFTITAQNNCGKEVKSITVNYNPCINPTVLITNPGSSDVTVTSPSYVFSAIVQNINRPGISLFVNNTSISNFTFNPSTGQIQSNLLLNAGSNVIRVEAQNNCGTISASTTIIYNNCIVPQLQLINPSTSGTTVSTSGITIKVNATGFMNRNEFTLLHNGAQISNFTMNNNLLEIPLQLSLGLNTITINGTNLCGSDATSFAVTYQNCVAPLISLITPATNISSTITGAFRCRMKVENSQQNNIQVMLNNQPITTFTYNAATKILEASLTLIAGANTIVINASNPCGTDVETVYINNENCKSPTVVINGTNNSTVVNSSYTWTAQIQNIANAQGISVSHNGNPINFDYSNGIVTCFSTLALGMNTFVVSAKNGCGKDSKSLTVQLIQCEQPSVSINGESGSTVTSAVYLLSANVINMASAQGITLTFNGTPINNFTYLNNQLTANINLNLGKNTFVLSAINACGNGTETFIVYYNQCIAPVVTLSADLPNNSITEATNITLNASIANYNNQTVIQVTKNGTVVSGYTNNNGQISGTINLPLGITTFIVNASNQCGQDTKTYVINRCKTPTISLITPATNTSSTITEAFQFRVKVENSEQNNINVMLNNQPISNFTYSAATKILEASLTLIAGANTIVINASNPCGTDVETIYINNGNCKSPTVVINGTNNSTVVNSSYTWTAQIQNIVNAQGLTVSQNGNPINFDYSNGLITCFSTLQLGGNLFVVNAANECGRDSKNLTVQLIKCEQPSVSINGESGSTVTSAFYLLNANVINMASMQGITLTFNGTPINNFTYLNNELTANINLIPGENTFVLSAINACGNGTETFIINYNLCDAPIVTLSANLPNNSITEATSITLNASITNYNNQTVIQVTKNGNILSGYNNNNGQISGTINLPLGITTLIVNASNQCGQDTKTYVINRCKAPTISLITPNNNQSNSSSSNYFIQLDLANVDNINMVNVTQNGIVLTNLTLSTTILGGQVILQPGLNTFVISVNTGCGVASTSFQITYAQQNNGNNISPNGQDNGTDNNGQKVNDGDNKNNKPVKPEPVKPVKPEPVKPVKPEPVKPVKPVTPEPVKPKPVTPDPVKPKPVTPEPDKPIKPAVPIPTEKGGGK